MSAATLHRLRPFVGPGAIVAIIAIFGALYPTKFLTPTNLMTNVLDTVSFLVIVAAAQKIGRAHV